MSTSSLPTEKPEWLILLPDNPGILPKRMEVRPKHFEDLTEHIESGLYKVGGAMLADQVKEGESMNINGTFLMAKADSKKELMEVLKEDIYTKSGVWDLEKVQVIPIKSAFIKS